MALLGLKNKSAAGTTKPPPDSPCPMSCPLRAEKTLLLLTEKDHVYLSAHDELFENLEDPHLAEAKLQYN